MGIDKIKYFNKIKWLILGVWLVYAIIFNTKFAVHLPIQITDPDFLQKMQAYQEAFSDRDQVENILVLPSIISSSNMKSVMTAYEDVGYKRIILSKMDEADYISSALELADTNSKSFAYFSIGQEVPFDMIPASKKIFADLIMNPEKMKDIKGEAFAFANS